MDRVVAMTVSCLPDRQDYLRSTLHSWRHVHDLDTWRFRFHLEPGPLQFRCFSMISEWRATCDISSVDIIQNDTRLGVLRNPWSAFESAFSRGALFVLLIEEDIVVSTDVLRYFSRNSDYYKTHSDVLAVCGSYFGEPGNPLDTYKDSSFCPCVWGTWSDRWNSVLRNTWDFDYSTGNPDGSQAGWDWNIGKRLLPQLNMVCVFPRVTRALHIGQYGVHMRPENFEESQASAFRAEIG